MEQATRQIQIGLNGQKHLQATAVDNVKSLIFAWQQMGQKIYHKLFRWAWVSRGVITVDDMKKRFPNLSQKEAEEMQLKEEASARELVPGIPELVPNHVRISVLFRHFKNRRWSVSNRRYWLWCNLGQLKRVFQAEDIGFGTT